MMMPDEDLFRNAVENLAQADALLFGRVTYELMEAGWRCSQGYRKHVDLKLVSRVEFGSGAVAMRYRPRR